ncbi:hypothetical protein M0Q50_04825 [bacterium]|jgi:hypothetical protein|nr:hypothetical protein [bacterium]
MKHVKKFNEELNTINSKDLDSWSVPKANEPKKSGSKILDKEIGQKVLDLFEENGLVIRLDNRSGPQPSLPGEDNFVEWRCELSKRKSFEDWMEWNGDDIDELNKKELKEKQKEYNSEYTNDELDKCAFSVFLPKGVKDIQSALSDASTYLKQLNNSVTSVLTNYISEYYYVICQEADELKKFLKLREIIINNDNIEVLTDISYRLYHDCKFVGYFYEEFGEDEGKQLFRDWLEILGEKCNF